MSFPDIYFQFQLFYFNYVLQQGNGMNSLTCYFLFSN